MDQSHMVHMGHTNSLCFVTYLLACLQSYTNSKQDSIYAVFFLKTWTVN